MRVGKINGDAATFGAEVVGGTQLVVGGWVVHTTVLGGLFRFRSAVMLIVCLSKITLSQCCGCITRSGSALNFGQLDPNRNDNADPDQGEVPTMGLK